MSRPLKADATVSTSSDQVVSASPTLVTSTGELARDSNNERTNEEKGDKSGEVLVNVIDLEATCFKPWAGETQDIIEIGISVLNLTTNSIAITDSILVKPTHSTITPFCTSLTTLTPEQVEQGGITFEQAVQVLEDKYHLSTRLFASYGAFDIKLLKKQLQREGVSVKLPQSFVNVKKLVAVSYKRKRECGMMAALSLCKLEHEGVHHRGDDDSRNISNIFLHLLLRHAKDDVIQKSTERVVDIH